MNCAQIRQLLHDYLDDDLSATAGDSIDRHLADCEGCRKEMQALESLAARARDLATEIPPRRDLWPAIETRIDKESSQGPVWWLQLAAAGIALAILSVPLSVWWVGHREEAPTATVQVEVEDVVVAEQAELARSEDGVLLARTDLLTAIERHRDIVADDALRVWVDNMNLLDQAIGELRAALAEDPQNLRLRMLLASRYQQERKLLQKVSRV